ncbi:MAG: hypothetical protein JNM18_07205 [Planctomycetaceae bacterium]|nr:hypothetical protein [Planctomycetaceae bacterium]
MDWQLPKFDAPCGSVELASAVISWRKWYQSNDKTSFQASEGLLANISDGNLTRLMSFASKASCVPTETRFPACTLFVRSRYPVGDLLNVVKFESRIPLDDVKVIARLAIICPREERFAILVEEHQGSLFIVGIVNTNGRLALPTNDGWPSLGAAGLTVELCGPGRLRVRELDLDLQLTPGALHVDLLENGDWESLFPNGLRQRSLEALQKELPGLEVQDHALAWRRSIKDTWTQMLRQIAVLRHGGAVVVLPEEHLRHVKIDGNLESMDIVKLANESILSYCAAMIETDSDQKRELLRVANIQIERLSATMRGISQLTAVDGCVVFDHHLRLRGFAGKIDAEDAARKSTLELKIGPLACFQNEDELLKSFGTRHGSAYKLCKGAPNSLAFVLSQDGGLRIFSSDATHVHVREIANP